MGATDSPAGKEDGDLNQHSVKGGERNTVEVFFAGEGFSKLQSMYGPAGTRYILPQSDRGLPWHRTTLRGVHA